LTKSSSFRREAAALKTDLGDTGLNEEWYTWQEIKQVIASKENGVRVWDLDTGELIRALPSGEEPVETLALTREPPRIVYAAGNIMYVADLPQAEYVRTLRGHFDQINAVSVIPDAIQAISVAHDNSVRLWNLSSGACLASFTFDNPLTAGAISPNAKKVVVGDELGQIHFLDVENLVADIVVK
jgi:WD40 repeat protein